MKKLQKYIDKEERWKTVPKIFHEIDGLLFHVTNEAGLKGIINDKSIKPYDGTFPAAWSVHKNATTYARKNNYVCLFDFQNRPIEEKLKYPSKWHNVVLYHSPFNFLIELDYDLLKDNLILNEVAVEETKYSIKFIPYVEIWHSKPIPLESFKSICIMKNTFEEEDTDYFIRKLSIDNYLFENIESYKQEVYLKYADEFERLSNINKIFSLVGRNKPY